MDYAQGLRKLMELKGYSMYRLAKEMPCSQTAVKKWLSGSTPNPVMKARIAEILGELPNEKPASVSADGLDAIDQLSPALVEELSRFVRLAKANPERALRFLAFANQEIESQL